MHRFNLRVYGILINDKKQILVADEYIRGGFYTKFPGGGLEFGEGTRDCLKRELKEELGIEAEIGDHIYTTDYFQMSAFRPEDQIISIYYFAKQLEELKVPLRSKPFDFDEKQMEIYKNTGETETFRLIDWKDFSDETVTLPIDKIVAKMIKDQYYSGTVIVSSIQYPVSSIQQLIIRLSEYLLNYPPVPLQHVSFFLKDHDLNIFQSDYEPGK
jgi:8-oxo-dGTP pyrophosphatase MutT (NUDIX family)